MNLGAYQTRLFQGEIYFFLLMQLCFATREEFKQLLEVCARLITLAILIVVVKP